MQYFDNEYFYTIIITSREVEDFAATWPCSDLSSKPVTFTFNKNNSDLVDTNAEHNHPNANGAAIVALSQDAQSYGAKRLKLNL